MDYFSGYADAGYDDSIDAARDEESHECTTNDKLDDTATETGRDGDNGNLDSPALVQDPLIVAIPTVNSAPHVETYDLEVRVQQNFVHPLTRVLFNNPKFETLHAPIVGPLLPHQVATGGFERMNQNHLTGYLENLHVNEYAFDKEHRNYHTYGVAVDPSDSPFLYQLQASKANNGQCAKTFARQQRLAVAVGIQWGQKLPADILAAEGAANALHKERKSKKRKKLDDASSDNYLGPWAPDDDDVTLENSKVQAEKEVADNEDKLEKSDTGIDANNTDNGIEAVVVADNKGQAIQKRDNQDNATTIFHGRSLVDYQGRSWIERPRNFKEKDESHKNYIPKAHVHSYVGHTMGVQAIRFFPESGHLLLSAGMDSKIKIWDVYNQRKCMRTYMGHTHAVRDIQFTTDGRKFYSCSYDRNILLWDTEYGKIEGTFTTGKTPFCVSVHPSPSEQNVFIIGTANKKAVQFDANSGQVVQEYNEHLAAVNSVTFCEDGRKIVTTSDDKKIFIWDFGIPVVVKHIAEACMHSMPSVTLHPSKLFFAAQSMDNQIVVYEAFGRFRFQSKRRFKKHICAGYAIHPGFSPDGRFIMSGDISGKLWFWDWKTMKNYRTLECHDAVCIDCAWHPTMTSRVATCGWDGLIKLWD